MTSASAHRFRQESRAYRLHFGRPPRGIWLPECAYRPGYAWSFPVHEHRKRPRKRRGLEDLLIEAGLKYFIIDSHMLKGGQAIGAYLSRFKALENFWKRFEKSYKPREEEIEKSPYEPHFL